MIQKLISKIKNFLNIGNIRSIGKLRPGFFNIGTIENEELLEVPYYQQYGFASIPILKTGVLVLSNNGDKTDPVIIGDNSNQQLQGLEEGDTIVWSSGGNTYMHLINDDESVNIYADTVNILNGDIFVKAGDIYVEDGDVFAKTLAGQVSLLNHTHISNGPGSETNPPTPTP